MSLRFAFMGTCLLLLGACGSRGDLPPPVIGEPRLSKAGSLSGVVGLTQDDWEVLDKDLRRAVFRLGFLERLTASCIELFPEHADFLGEFGLLVNRGLTEPVERGMAMEAERLRLVGDGRERAIVALLAMRQAEMDVEGMMSDQINALATKPVEGRQAVVTGCGLIFEKAVRRDLLRTVSQPLETYFARLEETHPKLHGDGDKIIRIRRYLARI
ncbi:MAG: hypothetical protein P1U65_16190 [Minwuia sp.]|nr:hypothetical protein [Minwuia sp.]